VSRDATGDDRVAELQQDRRKTAEHERRVGRVATESLAALGHPPIVAAVG
jgi:hypothetical protein